MPVTSSFLLLILLGGGVLFALASILEFIVGGVLGFVFFESLIGPGFGVPFRFFQLGLVGLSAGQFSIAKMVFDWIIWCLIFFALIQSVRVLRQR
jgi:hypothetical protein